MGYIIKIVGVICLFLSISIDNTAQEKHTISGYIKDAGTGEVLIGSSIYIEELEKGVATNVYGYYSLTVESGVYNVIARYIGYADLRQTVTLDDDVRLNIELIVLSDIMDEVIIEAEAVDNNTTGTQMGEINLNMDRVKTLPAFMGEVDILKTVQFLPGVSSGGEGNTGFYVRGGGPDQNLILLDEATVYNASHLFGFFSVFNADAIKNVKMIKGGMPANYGGRISSVLDINMKDGNYKEYHASGGIGLIASRLTIEGPLKKDTSSFIISGRRTYIDVLTEPFINDTAALKGSGYYFYDLTAKANYRFNDKNQLFISGYFGRDVFNFNDDNLDLNFKVPWGNATASLRWNHLFNDKLFVNTTAVFTDYDFAFEATQSDFTFRMESGIQDFSLKQDYTYFANSRHQIKFGWNVIRHKFNPSTVSGSSGETLFNFDTTKIIAFEPSVYLLDEIEINENLKMNIGLRFSAFSHIGPFKRYYKSPITGVTDSTEEWSSGEHIASYTGLEPRLSMRYLFKDNSSVKIGLSKNNQYIHLASMSGVSLPTDLWFPSSELVKPQIGIQYSAGYFRNFKKNKYEASVEVYYKDLQNLVEYKENSQPDDNINDNIDNQLTFGKGYSYGAEFFLKKSLGDFNGWIGYTWSKTMRTFEEINEGREFPAKYDRRNDLSVIMQYDITDRWNVGFAFVYATGSAITLPEKRYYDPIENRLITVWSDRNGYRLPAYHRADISVTFKGKEFKAIKNVETGEPEQKKKKVVSTWNLSVFNLYNRKNPYFLFFDYSGDVNSGNLDVGANQVSLFPILPSITWNFKF
jgi:hypothetical protein